MALLAEQDRSAGLTVIIGRPIPSPACAPHAYRRDARGCHPPPGGRTSARVRAVSDGFLRAVAVPKHGGLARHDRGCVGQQPGEGMGHMPRHGVARYAPRDVAFCARIAPSGSAQHGGRRIVPITGSPVERRASRRAASAMRIPAGSPRRRQPPLTALRTTWLPDPRQSAPQAPPTTPSTPRIAGCTAAQAAKGAGAARSTRSLIESPLPFHARRSRRRTPPRPCPAFGQGAGAKTRPAAPAILRRNH
jgi:hypothetical protein